MNVQGSGSLLGQYQYIKVRRIFEKEWFDNMGFEIDDIMNDTVLGIPREKLEAMLSQNEDNENIKEKR